MTIKTYKFRLNPTKEQEVLLSKHFGCTRFTYNWALDYKTKHYKETKRNIHWMELTSSGVFFDFKKEHEWIKEVNSQSIVASIGNLDNAYKNFFEGRSKFPEFKKKSDKQSFQVPQHGKIDIIENKLHIPKFKGGIDCIFHRPLPSGKHGTYTIEKRPSGRYFVSVMVHTETDLPSKPTPKNAIGLDFGLKTFITTSEGQKIQSPEYLKVSLIKLVIYKTTVQISNQKNQGWKEQRKTKNKSSQAT